jgi:hypothetical protein
MCWRPGDRFAYGFKVVIGGLAEVASEYWRTVDGMGEFTGTVC